MAIEQQFGGRVVDQAQSAYCQAEGIPGVWNFGYTPDIERTREEQAVDASVRAMMPSFEITGAWNDDPEKVFIWEAALAVNGGKHFRTFWQRTGSCVGNGGGQATRYLQAVEIYRDGEAEEYRLPFWLLPYGKSRQYAGMRGRGEGSFGSAFAKAAMDDGFLDAKQAGLPQPEVDNDEEGLSWGANAEYAWSDGAAIDTRYLTRQHLIKSAAPINNGDQAWEAISNWYPMTIASDWGGQMRPEVVDGVLLNRRVTRWMHQMSVIGRWRHPTLGKLFYILNSWGTRTHGICPSGAPPGGFWVKFADIDAITRQKDSFAFSGYQGFPAQEFKVRV